MDNQPVDKRAIESQLKDKVYFTLASMRTMDRETVEEIMDHFSANRLSLSARFLDLQRHDTVELGQWLQAEAISNYDGNPHGGYALWLTGAWLESTHPVSPEGHEVYNLLNVQSPAQLLTLIDSHLPLDAMKILHETGLPPDETHRTLSWRGWHNTVWCYVQSWLSIRSVLVPIFKNEESDR